MKQLYYKLFELNFFQEAIIIEYHENRAVIFKRGRVRYEIILVGSLEEGDFHYLANLDSELTISTKFPVDFIATIIVATDKKFRENSC